MPQFSAVPSPLEEIFFLVKSTTLVVAAGQRPTTTDIPAAVEPSEKIRALLSALTILFQLISVAGTAPAKCPISRVASDGATFVGPKSSNRVPTCASAVATANKNTKSTFKDNGRGNFIG